MTRNPWEQRGDWRCSPLLSLPRQGEIVYGIRPSVGLWARLASWALGRIGL